MKTQLLPVIQTSKALAKQFRLTSFL